MNERRQAILFAVVLIPAIAGLYAATQLIQPAAVQPSVVQTFTSLQFGAGPPTHDPPLHVSFVVQALPSLHGTALLV